MPAAASTRSRRSISISTGGNDLATQPKVGLTLESGIRRLVDTIFASNGIDIDYAFTVRSIATALAFVEAGLGVAVLPSYALALKGSLRRRNVFRLS
jgi:DNA-binding transcriptional LysR family regulator